MLLISLILKYIYIGMDPRGCFMLMSSSARGFLATFHLPWGFSCALLVALFWHETLSQNGFAIYGFLHKLRIPFFVFVALLFVIELGFNIPRLYGHTVMAGNAVVYFILTIGLGTFYIITGVRVLRAVKRANYKKVKRVEIRKVCFMIRFFGGFSH